MDTGARPPSRRLIPARNSIPASGRGANSSTGPAICRTWRASPSIASRPAIGTRRPPPAAQVAESSGSPASLAARTPTPPTANGMAVAPPSGSTRKSITSRSLPSRPPPCSVVVCDPPAGVAAATPQRSPAYPSSHPKVSPIIIGLPTAIRSAAMYGATTVRDCATRIVGVSRSAARTMDFFIRVSLRVIRSDLSKTGGNRFETASGSGNYTGLSPSRRGFSFVEMAFHSTAVFPNNCRITG
jgi:hypothetical protein